MIQDHFGLLILRRLFILSPEHFEFLEFVLVGRNVVNEGREIDFDCVLLKELSASEEEVELEERVK